MVNDASRVENMPVCNIVASLKCYMLAKANKRLIKHRLVTKVSLTDDIHHSVYLDLSTAE